MYNIGDSVVLIDGTDINNNGPWFFVDAMLPYVGSVGVVSYTKRSRGGTVFYGVEFSNKSLQITGDRQMRWLCKEEWLEPVVKLSDSDELNAIFDDM